MHRYLPQHFFFTLHAFTLLALAIFSASAAPAGDYPDPARWQPAIDRFNAEAAPAPGAIVATGSSSMRGWHHRMDADLAPLTLVKRGFGGSNMLDVRYWLRELVLKHRPRAVMLYQGDNDVALGATPDQILGHFDAIVSGIHAVLPATRIYVFAVKPSPSRWALWPRMTATNQRLMARCQDHPRLIWVDVATPMLGADGQPLASIFVEDNLHMNAAGYDLWRDAARPVIMAGEAKHEVH